METSPQKHVSKFLDGDVIIDRENPFKSKCDNEDLNRQAGDDGKSQQEVRSGSTRAETKCPDPMPARPLMSAKVKKKNKNTRTSLIFTKHSPVSDNIVAKNKANDSKNFNETPKKPDLSLFKADRSCSSPKTHTFGKGERSPDAYADLVKELTMNTKPKKRSNLKKIFPTNLFSLQPKPKKTDSALEEASGGASYTVDSSFDEIRQSSLKSVGDTPYQFSKYLNPLESRLESNDDVECIYSNIDQLGVQKPAKSPSSSSSTLVSDCARYSKDIPVLKKSSRNYFARKGSLKSEYLYSSKEKDISIFEKYTKSGRLSAPITDEHGEIVVKTDKSIPGPRNLMRSIVSPKPIGPKHFNDKSKVSVPTDCNSRRWHEISREPSRFKPIETNQTLFVPDTNAPHPDDYFYHDRNKHIDSSCVILRRPILAYDNKGTEVSSYSLPPDRNVHEQHQYKDPVSVGAEMKIFTTNVMISPKKCSEVKQRKEHRAKSISPVKKDSKNLLVTRQAQSVDYQPDTSPTRISRQTTMCGNERNGSTHLRTITTDRSVIIQKPSHVMSPGKVKICRPVFIESIPDTLNENVPVEKNDTLVSSPHFYQSPRQDCKTDRVDNSNDSMSEMSFNNFIDNQSGHKTLTTSSPVSALAQQDRNKRAQTPPSEPTQNISSGAISKQSPNVATQKIRNLQNVEAFYWHQLRKLKEKQEQDFLKHNLSSSDILDNRSLNIRTESINIDSAMNPPWRCRSVSPGFTRSYEYRSLSLPRSNESVSFAQYPPNTHLSNAVNSGLLEKQGIHHHIANPNFIRGSPRRNTIVPTYNIPNRQTIKPQSPYYLNKRQPARDLKGILTDKKSGSDACYQNADIIKNYKQNAADPKLLPIFKRGSLSSETSAEVPYREKKVSFTNSQLSDSQQPNSVYENLSSLTLKTKFPSETDSVFFPNNPGMSRESRFAATQADGYTDKNTIYGKIAKKDSVEKVYAKIFNRDDQNRMAKTPVEGDKPLGQGARQSAAEAARGLLSRRVRTAAASAAAGAGASESESGSEAGEVQRIMLGAHPPRTASAPTFSTTSAILAEEEWNPDGKNRGDGALPEGGRGRVARRDDPRRHTLGGDLLRSAPPHSALIRGMDVEPSLGARYPPPSSAMLFDDDPGIMSEVETASTGFRRGGKQRSSLPVVRTPSKTLERPLGLVFLQYRSETKRALLPNEITSIDTVKALFVRSFPKQLTMEYLDSPLVKIYIHDSSKDMFYELEDLRSHLRDIRDRSVLRLFESADVSGGAFPGALGGAVGMPASGPPGSGPPSWDQDQSYFSEPEFESDYHHQHIHKSKVNAKPPAYYMGTGAPSTLPRGGSLMRAYSPASGLPVPADRMKTLPGAGAPPKPLRAYGSTTSVIRGGSERCFPFSPPVDALRAPEQLYSLPADRIHSDGYMSSPERGSRGAYEEPYYTQYVGPPRGGMTPVIDEESGDASMLDDQYSLYSVKIPTGPRPAVRGAPYDGNRLNAHSEDLQQRMRVEHMERQLANLTGLVQKALQTPGAAQSPRDFQPGGPHFRNAPQESADPFLRTERPPKLGKGRYHKSVSFEKSVSFSDEPPDMNSPKQHSPQHAADSKPPKPAIKSSTLPRMSSQERDRLKPIPPPKPKTLAGGPGALMGSGGQQIVLLQSMDYYTQLKVLQKRCKDLRMEMRNLRRMTLTQAHTMREMICDTFMKFRTATAGGGDFNFHEDSMRIAREEEIYTQEMLKLEGDLCDLETTVEQLRGNVINRKTRVNMLDVEKMALILSKSSKTVADLKVRFPSLHEGMKGMLSTEMEKVVREEKFLKEEPERLEMALRRCKKLTGTLVTLKRLASVQEQRLPCDMGRMSPGGSIIDDDEEDQLLAHESNAAHSKGTGRSMGSDGAGGMAALPLGGSVAADSAQRTENALDALLDELQTFARPPSPGAEGEGEESGLLRRLRGPVSSDAELSPPVAPRGQAATKPPVPERNPDLLQMAGRRAPPPPPPRTSSRSPLASPAALLPMLSASNSSSCDSVDSQEGVSKTRPSARHDLLEQRHQELLKKQKALQEQYARLQQKQRGGNALTVVPPPDLKKTGSESNLLTKMGLNMTPATPISSSLTHLAGTFPRTQAAEAAAEPQAALTTTSKVYETDIL